MNFADRPNADAKFLRRVIAIRDEEYEAKVRHAELLGAKTSVTSDTHEAAIRALHAEGLNDQQIAARIGFGHHRVRYIRMRLGLASNHDAVAAGKALGALRRKGAA